jgi:hypothetical protein
MRPAVRRDVQDAPSSDDTAAIETRFHSMEERYGRGCDLNRRCVSAKKLATPYWLHSKGARIDEITCAPARKAAESEGGAIY